MSLFRLAHSLSLFAAFLSAAALAQPVAPTPAEVDAMRAASQIDPHRAAASTPLTVNVTSREEVRQFYRAVYGASENIPIGWTGDYSTGAAGTTSSAFKDAVLLRINFYRALAGVPASVVLNSTFSGKTQQAALMMSANNQLQHTGIPTTWTFYTADGAEAAAKSNLDLGRDGPASVEAYMNDFGSNNTAVPHRRWVLYPQTLEMGTGDVPGNTSFNASNALWVQDGNFFGTRPATRNEFVAYPAPGFVPYSLVYPRWSFSYANADFSTATVSVSRAGANVPLTVETVGSGFGENTLVWDMDNLDPNAGVTSFARPTADTVYAVTVNNVRINGTPRNFTYNVTVFDPDVAGSDFTPTTVAGPATASVGTATGYTAAKPGFAGTFEWRSLQLAAYSKTYGAENGLDGIAATTSPGYNVVQSGTVGAGASSYRLGHFNPRFTQVLLLPETFYVSGSSSALTFLSRLGIAVSIEVARAQISTDDGVSWVDGFTQAGTSQLSSPANTEAAFVSRTVSLAPYAGRTVRVRFAFTIDSSGTAFSPGDNTVGWFIDNIAVTGVQSATASAPTGVASGSSFSFTPAVGGTLALQARGVLFGAYPTEWGPVTSVTAAEGGTASRITNLSVLTSLGGGNDSFTLGYVVGNASTGNPLSLILRAVGPSLSALNVSGTLANPKLETFAGSAKTGENDDWGGTAQLKSAFTAAGAFNLAADNTKDAATLASITSRDNSVKVSATDNGAGVVIAEVYDTTAAANFSASGPRLVNVSVLKPIGNGLTVGFVIGGTGAKRILIRAIGPALAGAPFNVPGTIADPKLELFNSASQSIGSNDNWGGTAELTAAFTAAGAFGFAANSLDAALVVTLNPGLYTVQVTPANGATGTGLVEVYEVP